MAVTPSSSLHSSSSSSPLSSLTRSPLHFATIHEDDREDDLDDELARPYRHEPTPLHPKTKPSSRRPATVLQDLSVSCNKCRPSSRGNISVVPVDSSGPNGLFRSFFGSIARKSPLQSSSSWESSNEWKIAAEELSRKLVLANSKRDEALLEASRLKQSVSDLERKLDRLEFYCRDMRAAIDDYGAGPTRLVQIEPFSAAVADARIAVRQLSRCLMTQLRASPRCLHRVASLFASDGLDRTRRGSLLVGMESMLNRVFYSDFERSGDGEGLVADPTARCEASRLAFEAVHRLEWEEVLSRGTRHYSEGLSRFCDRRMSEVVGMLGWARVWPEDLLRAFFVAARGVWAVRLLARSVHPAVPILRVDSGARFDPVYMDDAAEGTESVMVAGNERPESAMVRLMVAPGFYVQAAGSGAVKCRVIVAFVENRGNEGKGPEN